MSRLVLLASYPKSGNTWLRAILTSIWRDGTNVDINRLMIPSITSRRFVDAHLGICSAELTDSELDALRGQLYEIASAHVRPGKQLYLKTHELRTSLSLPPEAAIAIHRIVYVVRDPRDVAPSLARHLGITVDSAIDAMEDNNYRLSDYPWRAGRHVAQRLASWNEHVCSWTNLEAGLPTLIVRYEDLLTSPEESIQRLSEFLQLSIGSQRIKTAIEATRISVLRDKELKEGFVEKPEGAHRFFNDGRQGGWRHALSAAQVERIESVHAETMKRFGYLK